MKYEFYSLVVSDILRNKMAEANKREIISTVNRENASKPRNKHHSEVMEVIRLTWDRYPCAPKTALLDALSVHYHKKVSRNALDNWISLSGLRPPKPKKYTSFELVFPPVAG
ncbi:hypothetical protein GEO37_01055 [Klebsiella pneumoniae]|nr:hypothetical protein [Klebsiella pneumoniae]